TALSFASLLAACGSDDGIEGGGGDQSAEIEVIPKGEVSDQLNFSNWPLYIDKEKPTSLDDFEQEYGTKVKYTEEINDNVEFFGKVRQIYARGDSGGRDMHVVTDWMASKMKQLGYVQKLDKSELPNVDANLLDSLKSPSFDPNREFSVPWQSGYVAIGYRKDLVGGTPESVNDIFDPKLKGKVTMLTEMVDTVGLVMLGMGADPAKDGTESALEAIEKIEAAQKDGQIRRFTGNDYIRDLTKGDSVMSFVWSGDAISLKAISPNLDVFLPPEGFMLFSDNMQIPVGAPHAYTAQRFMDFVYRPEIAAKIAAYVNYITPVKGAQEELRKIDPELAESTYIFPPPDVLERSYIFRQLSADEERELQDAFQRAIGA
ncbi:MAG: polyamine ABC transporter substrate-binding protein, partial [Thermoleophilaceae bacterium]